MQFRAKLLVSVALVATVPFVIYVAVEMVRFFKYQELIERNGGEIVWLGMPPPTVSISFYTDDLGRNRPARDLTFVLQQLKSWSAITSLTVEGVDSAEFDQIVEFPNLELLRMKRTHISDDQWPKLVRMLTLRDLRLEGAEITPSAADAIAGLSHLKKLDLPACKLSAIGLRFVASLEAIEVVRFWQGAASTLSAGDLAAIGSRPRLKELLLFDTPLDRGAFAELGRAHALETLTISGAPINSNSLVSVAKLPKLRYLDLTCTGLSNDTLATLDGSRSIETLLIGENSIDANGLLLLRAIPNLRHLGVGVKLYRDAEQLLPGVEAH